MTGKFKVGDRVEIQKNCDVFSECAGHVGVIEKIDEGDFIYKEDIWVRMNIVVDEDEDDPTLLLAFPHEIKLAPAEEPREIPFEAVHLQELRDKAVALKYDDGKPRVSLIPSIAIEKEGAVLGFGEQKYASHNWRKGMKYSKLLDSAMRHLIKLKEGEDNDEESGLPHWAHVRCCMGFLGEYMERGLGEDDRYIQPVRVTNDTDS